MAFEGRAVPSTSSAGPGARVIVLPPPSSEIGDVTGHHGGHGGQQQRSRSRSGSGSGSGHGEVEVRQLSVSVDRMASSSGAVHGSSKVGPGSTITPMGSTPTSSDGGGTGLCGYILIGISLFFVVIFFPFSLCVCIKIVQEYERAVIYRLGRLLKGGARGPGLFFILPCTDDYKKVDMRTASFDIPPQEVLTRDSVTVAVDAVVFYRINNATLSVNNVEDYGRSTRLLSATTLRNVLGTKILSEILSDRDHISEFMQSSLDEATDPWGILVERVELKDVRLPVQLQRAMAAEAEASREARAKVIAAEGEHKASRALKEAADILSEAPAALQLRYLQTLNSISAEKNSTIIFPLPLEIMRGLIKK